MKKIILKGSVILALTISQLTAQSISSPLDLLVGQKMKPLEFEQVLQSEQSQTSLETLEGRVTVLNYWATWCAPCIAKFDGMNKVANKLKNEPVDFIHVTDEDEQKISRFLERRKLVGMIGMDLDHSVFQLPIKTKYGDKTISISGLPTLIIVDQLGIIRQVDQGYNSNKAEEYLEESIRKWIKN